MIIIIYTDISGLDSKHNSRYIYNIVKYEYRIHGTSKWRYRQIGFEGQASTWTIYYTKFQKKIVTQDFITYQYRWIGFELKNWTCGPNNSYVHQNISVVKKYRYRQVQFEEQACRIESVTPQMPADRLPQQSPCEGTRLSKSDSWREI